MFLFFYFKSTLKGSAGFSALLFLYLDYYFGLIFFSRYVSLSISLTRNLREAKFLRPCRFKNVLIVFSHLSESLSRYIILGLKVYPVVPGPCWKTILFPLDSLVTLVISQLTIDIRVYLWTLNSNPLIYVHPYESTALFCIMYF